MRPEWRTSTVVALCRRMLDTRQFDALPILADALQDAGCDDERLFEQCREPDIDAFLSERLVNLVFSEETATAVRWLERFISRNGYSLELVRSPRDFYGIAIEIGRTGIDEGFTGFWTEDGSNVYRESEEARLEFYGNWSLATGISVPEAQQRKITFSCSC